MILGILVGFYLHASTYTRVMEIVEIDNANDLAICVDAVGYEWEFSEPEDLCVGDIVVCTMYDKGTENTILDDEILHVEFSGYTREMFN